MNWLDIIQEGVDKSDFIVGVKVLRVCVLDTYGSLVGQMRFLRVLGHC